jgi:hypothetical protein
LAPAAEAIESRTLSPMPKPPADMELVWPLSPSAAPKIEPSDRSMDTSLGLGFEVTDLKDVTLAPVPLLNFLTCTRTRLGNGDSSAGSSMLFAPSVRAATSERGGGVSSSDVTTEFKAAHVVSSHLRCL